MEAHNHTVQLLDIQDMNIWYATNQGESKAVNGLDMVLAQGEIFGLAGESGCGKSTLIQGILRLTRLPGYIKGGKALFRYAEDASGQRSEVDLLSLPIADVKKIRWRHISYIPQSAMNVLNPVLKIEPQIMDAVRTHSHLSKKKASELIAERLEMVGLSRKVAQMYPHELSGGMKQRVTIASAIVLTPELLIADEPTTALDVNVQRVILQELMDIREKLGLTILYVSHDIAVHAEIADRIGVMYAGVIVEIGPALDILRKPKHPYSHALVEAVPEIGGTRKRLSGLPGVVPSPRNWPPGCAFNPRCARAMDVCCEKRPELREISPGRWVACHLFES